MPPQQDQGLFNSLDHRLDLGTHGRLLMITRVDRPKAANI
jgi:hypothetical protein